MRQKEKVTTQQKQNPVFRKRIWLVSYQNPLLVCLQWIRAINAIKELFNS